MGRAVHLFFRFLDLLLAALLAAMAGMVFVNVVLRYAMNSGIAMSDELSRFAFVWLTFIGAVVAHHHRLHMGMETLVARFGRRGRLVLMGFSDLLILGGAVVLTVGTWKQLPINASMNAAVSGLSMAWVYGIGLFAGTGIALITLERLFRLLRGRITEAELAAFGGDMDHHAQERVE
ncbi:TRAP transporter small permease [Falsirhodobacter halotolerans]|uniref:TRAP transporter small permease n=1 Tax=Falsirhodobacter halotolerans TaxID=1146892 RepID=UPI001FD5A60E|nr:TRAP transporter small permease [Falsirhodobacter halotolerans]MCJ8140044.1 TRAP transporter small permease [Falsirhodobacter halotolerans]